MTPEMEIAAKALEDARLEYGLAESTLAVARADLTRAERRFHEVWGKIIAEKMQRNRALPPSDRANADVGK